MDQTILIVEDEPSIRTMVRFSLEKASFVVEEAENAQQAREKIAAKLPSLIILDWMLPKTTGPEFTKSLRKNDVTENIPIIMLTAKAEEEHKILALDCGADDYMVKPFSPRELLSRIKAVLRRGPLVKDTETIDIQELHMDVKGQQVLLGGRPLRLGPLEYRLLHFFMTHCDRVYTRNDLLNHVWGMDAYIDERTVDVHIRRLRKQLKPLGHDKLIQTVHGMGYRFSEKYVDDK